MLTISVIGLGNRGTEYMKFVKLFHKKAARIVALCDISQRALDDISPIYKVPKDKQFLSSEEFFKAGVMSDGLFITTQDTSHYEITKAAIECGYKYILLEKPVSEHINECEDLKKLAEKNNCQLIICHVLRYSNYYKKIKQLIKDKVIGELVGINHTENVGYYHFAHSYVRGNWKKREDSTPSMLAKCCHDVDLIQWFADSECESVISYGDLKYFNKHNAPEGATEFCLGGCKVKRNCPYDAEALYITDPFWKAKFIKYFRRTMTGKSGANKADMYEVLKSKSYGKCVFLNDNNVLDYQTITMQFKNGVTAIHTLNAFSKDMKRTSHIIGTKGELICDDKMLRLNIFGGKSRRIWAGNPLIPGHLEGDFRTVSSFIELMQGKLSDKSYVTTIDATIASHAIVMAAEESRLNNSKVIKLK